MHAAITVTVLTVALILAAAWLAVGAIAVGAQIIVCGRPKLDQRTVLEIVVSVLSGPIVAAITPGVIRYHRAVREWNAVPDDRRTELGNRVRLNAWTKMPGRQRKRLLDELGLR